jgi:hypothetical protein
MMTFAALAAPQAAFADAPTGVPEAAAVSSMPMTVGGYDADIAEANGYQIVTNPDGSQSSVPITEDAKAQQAAAEAAKAEYYQDQNTNDGMAPLGVVDGNCGSSWINATKQANDTVAYQTGYVVWGAVVDSQWDVVATGFISGSSVRLYPIPNSGTWATEGALYNVIGPGIANVTIATSFAVLASGQVCYSGGPSAAFG